MCIRDRSNVSSSDLNTNQTISSQYSEADALTTLETVVSEINYLLSFLKEQSKPGSNGEDGGPLHNDHFIRFTENKIKNLTSTAIVGYDNDSVYLSNFGVVTELDGTLSIDKILSIDRVPSNSVTTPKFDKYTLSLS